MRYGEDGYFWINDTRPVMVMHPIKPLLDGKDLSKITDPNGKHLFTAIVKTVQSSDDGAGYVSYLWPKPGSDKPVGKVAYVKLFKPWGWIIGSGVYIQDVSVGTQVAAIGGAAFGVFVVLLLIGWIVIRSLTDPLRRTVSTLSELSSGTVDLNTRLSTDGNDEISQVGQSVNTLLETMQEVVRGIKEVMTSLNSAMETLGEAGNEAGADAEKQHANTEELATAMNQMVATVQEVARNAHTAADSTQLADDETGKGRRVVEATMQAIQSLAEELGHSRDAVQALADDSNSIGTVLDVINGVAEQTNLLALNAAIEAARAGEQGRGFAVVADEVRTLAQRTQESTKEIQEIIQRLQEGAHRAAKSMTENAERAGHTVEESANAGDSLNAITAAVSTINDMNTQIAGAAEEQAATAEEINRGVISIRDTALSVSQRVQGAKGASDEMAMLLSRLEQTLRRLSA